MQGRIPILMYHQIDAIPPKVDVDGVRAKYRSLTVSPASFARQMWLLNVLGYRGVSMSELMAYLRGEKTFTKDGKVVGITFDDGYQNNLIHALPVLKRYGFSSTCYVVSDLVGQTNSWDTIKGVQSKPLMAASEMREWIAGSQEIGSHTQQHVNLLDVEEVTAKTEIFDSKSTLEALTGRDCQHFCYPYGHYDVRHAVMAKEAGYESATTVVNGYAGIAKNAFELPRLGVMKNTHLLKFWQMIRV
jgi:peptidoglycan/xylan/chitin deacetylase (PgdA/CDA1 family)